LRGKIVGKHPEDGKWQKKDSHEPYASLPLPVSTLAESLACWEFALAAHVVVRIDLLGLR